MLYSYIEHFELRAMSTARVQHRAVRFVGLCGASGIGKTTIAKCLVDALHSPCIALSADWYFKKPRAFAACRKSPCCWEQVSSVDCEALARDSMELGRQLSSAPPGPVPDLTFGHSAQGVHGIGKSRPVRITRDAGVRLTHEPVYVLIEGFVLFGDPSVCEVLHAGCWLTVDDPDLLARRRYEREGGAVNDLEWAEFREDYMGHIY